jgi:hypothetical protein
MVFRDGHHQYHWPLPVRGASDVEGADSKDPATSLSLKHTLTELAVTIIGFVAVIVLITATLRVFLR